MSDELHREDEYTGKFNLRTWGELLAYLMRYKRWMFTMVAASISLAGCECVFTWMPRVIIDAASEQGLDAPIVLHSCIFMASVACFSLMLWLFIRTAGRLSTQVSYDIRQESFQHLQRLSFSYYDRHQAGWLVSRLTSDCERISRTITWGILMEMVWGSCMIVGVSAILLIWNLKLGLMVMAALPVIAAAAFFFQKRIVRTSREVRRLNSTITAAFSECITGMMTTRTLVRERENHEDFTGRIDGMYEQSILLAVLSSLLWPVVMTISGAAAALALWKGGQGAMLPADAPGHITPGTLVQFVNAATMLIFPIMEMSRVFADLLSTQTAAERVFGLLNTVPEVQDTPEAREAIERAAAGALPAGMARDGRPDRIGTIEFRHVDFAYEQGKAVLTDFSLVVPEGATVALVGPTGGGKTTIANLVCRFYEPTAGEILFDGVEYRRRSLGWLQSRLGIVLQQPHLFAGTITENIRYGRLDATDAEVERAAELVRADGFIRELPEGFATEVGEDGSRLSTGQKQLVSFARAVLADPMIFVMDEATSSVDTETEKLIQDGLSAVLSGRISFVIAHRLSTIRSADMILVIDGGRIIEQGNHHELLARQGRYWSLYTNQFSEEKTAELLRGDTQTPSEDPA